MPDEKQIFYRNRVSNSLVWLIAVFMALYMLVMLVQATEESDPSGGLVGLAAVFMIAFLIPAFRYPRHGVVATESKVIIRNILRTHVLLWGDVQRFELSRYAPWPMIGVVVLKNGERIPMTGVQFALATRFAQNTVAALNERLAIASGSDKPQGELADGAPV